MTDLLLEDAGSAGLVDEEDDEASDVCAVLFRGLGCRGLTFTSWAPYVWGRLSLGLGGSGFSMGRVKSFLGWFLVGKGHGAWGGPEGAQGCRCASKV